MQAEKLAMELQETNDKLNEANRKLVEASLRDYLTGLYNRKYLFDILDKEISMVERYGAGFSVLMII